MGKVIFGDGTVLETAAYPVETEPCIFVKRRTVCGKNREVLRLTVKASQEQAAACFRDGTSYAVENGDGVLYDKSDYCVAGDIVDHRDGRVTVYMGKKTEEELTAELFARDAAALFYKLKTGGDLND